MLNSALVEFVDSAPASPPDAPKLSLSAQIVWAVLIIATLYVSYFSHLGAIGFVGPDEPRYAWIARDMAETGDWVTPRLYGNPWFEKPPLYYWCAALSFKIFGVSEAAARLPSAIAALLATLALAWLALRLYGSETARWLLLLLPSSVGMIGFSHAASTDMLFSATLTLALVAAAILLRVTEPSSVVVAQHAAPAAFLFGLFLGLAVLAKGPAALVLLGGAAFSWVIFTKRWRDALRLFHPVSIAAFCLTALPWYILCARRNPEFFRVFIIEHNFKRYLTPEFQHIQPFWYYAAVLLIALLPWTALLLWSALTGAIRLWRTRTISDATLLLLCWSAFCILFFSISKSKLPGYILPAIPTIALLMMRVRFVCAVQRRKPLAGFVLGAALFFTLCFMAFVPYDTFRRGIDLSIVAALLQAGFAVTNLLLGAGLAFRIGNKAGTFVSACSVLPILAVLLFAGRLVPSIFHFDPSGKTLAQELQRGAIPSDEIAVKVMSRGQRYSLSFYLRREITEWDTNQSRQGYLLAGGGRCESVAGEHFRCEPVAFDLDKTGYFLFRVTPRLVNGAAGSGKVQ